MLMEDEGIVIAGLLVGLNDCMIYLYVVFSVSFMSLGAMLMEDEGIVIAGLLVGLNDCMICLYVVFSVSFMSLVPC